MRTLDDNIARLQTCLRTERFGRTCRWYDAVDSTNSIAFSWAEEGASTGSLVVADFQKQGRGRFKRMWSADPGRNLTFSLIIDPRELRPNLEMLPVATAVAVSETLEACIEPHRPLVKWPNDVILAGRKVCGILIESSLPSGRPDRGGRVVAGIGINVNQDNFPEELSETATSLFRVLGRPVDRIELLADILIALESVCGDLKTGQVAPLIERYERLLIGLGDTVRFTMVDADATTEGTMLGVDESGGLRVRTTAGVEVLRSGEVTIGSGGALPQTKIGRLPGRSLPTTSS